MHLRVLEKSKGQTERWLVISSLLGLPKVENTR